MEYEIENPLVGDVPSSVGEHGRGICDAGSEAHVGNRRAHVMPGQEVAAVAYYVRVELVGKVIDVNEAAGAHVAGILMLGDG